MSKKKVKSAVTEEKLYKPADVLNVISDHAGTVLGEDEPDPYLTEAEEADARQVFEKNDKDKSGRIDKKEMQAMLKDLSLELDPDAWEKFSEDSWRQADVDENGRLDMEEVNERRAPMQAAFIPSSALSCDARARQSGRPSAPRLTEGRMTERDSSSTESSPAALVGRSLVRARARARGSSCCFTRASTRHASSTARGCARPSAAARRGSRESSFSAAATRAASTAAASERSTTPRSSGARHESERRRETY